jgi:phosphoribosylamine--glycine ligase
VNERILLIGSGGREDALAHAMSLSPHCEHLYCAPGNPGIERWAEVVALDVNEHHAVVLWCLEKNITLVVVGPDQFLADGIADPLRAAGLDVFGPSQAAAKIEWSKSFAKDCMQRFGIPTAASRVFTGAETDAAEAYVRAAF